MRTASKLSLAACWLTCIGLAACASPPTPGAAATGSNAAVATLAAATPDGPAGRVTFAPMGGGVDVHVQASGLAPGSVHGFHVHDNGVCAGPDFASAGGHFNPGKQPHGPQDGAHHRGDMPSLTADSSGQVDAHFMLAGASLTGADGYAGHAVILHANADDYMTQPTGNSGGRVACGVITGP